MWILASCFLLMTCLLFIFIFILEYGNDVRQKADSSDFLFEFKMGPTATETTCNINNTVGPGIVNERAVQWRFKKFCKEDESFEDEEHSVLPSKIDNNQLRAIIEAGPLTST